MTKHHDLLGRRHLYGCCLMFLAVFTPLCAQNLSVSGTITDGTLPVAGATVSIKNGYRGVVSNFDGMYQIMARASDTLLISFLGYQTQTIAVNNRTSIDIMLVEDAQNLKEVVINAGYYSVTERKKTGSIAKLTAKEIEQQPVITALDALQGRVPGLDVTPTTGLAGGGYMVRIRGQNSIAAGNAPLYIIDGVPFDAQTMSNSSISVLILPGEVNPLNTLDPASIASIEVLKDADATAIYGSRGANGVILITTKKGQIGKTKISIETSTTFISPTKFLELLNTQEYVSMRLEALANDGFTEFPFGTQDVNGTWDINRYTDWQKELIGNSAYNRTGRISISGGSDRTLFNIGGSFMKETNVFPMDFNYKRTSFFTNVAHRSQNDKLHIQFSANYGQDSNSLPSNDLARIARLLPPNAPPLYDADGELNWEHNTWDNPLAALNGTYANTSSTLIANTVVGYSITKGLELKANLGYNSADIEELQLNPHTIYNPAYGLTSASSYSMENKSSKKSWIVEPQMDASIPLAKGLLKMTVGATIQEQNDVSRALMGSGYATNELLGHFSAAQVLEVLKENTEQYRYIALFARLNYSWKDQYLLNVTGRRDGSSRFGPGNRFANFGAIGAAWIFSESSILQGQTWLPYGKVRASYGITGNDQIGNYEYLNTYELADAGYNGQIGLIPSHLLNPFFAWERNKKSEFALELGLWKNRLSFQGAYYHNKSDNLLLGYPLPGTTGFGSINGNLDATVVNYGWEFDLQSTWFQHNQFAWNTSFQISIPKNKLVSFEGLENSTYANQLVIGQPLSVYKLYQFKGVNPDTGLFEFHDFNKDGVISSAEDRNYYVDLSPKFHGSISNALTYKNWNFDFTFQFVKKQGFNEFYTTEPPGIMQNQPTSVLNHWQQPGDQSPMQLYTTGWNFPAYESYSRFTASNGVVSDASFIRLKTASLAYRLKWVPQQSFQCTLFLQAQNLLTFTKFKGGDPEQITGFLPPMKRVSMGVKLEL